MQAMQIAPSSFRQLELLVRAQQIILATAVFSSAQDFDLAIDKNILHLPICFRQRFSRNFPISSLRLPASRFLYQAYQKP